MEIETNVEVSFATLLVHRIQLLSFTGLTDEDKKGLKIEKSFQFDAISSKNPQDFNVDSLSVQNSSDIPFLVD